ncbi:MAG: right-handed parallel beta-helix repeat-containing protein [Tannerellaceae bacterium]|jgi:pectate lyase|nr:right-handed parallel beta-helix repeat-containing protein [Tannerellaceae bacterium]
MKKVRLLALLTVSTGMFAQSVSYPDDAKQRGYYDRPYKRYEAEPGKCAANGLFLSPACTQTELQSEASNAAAIRLVHKGAYIQWKNDEAADGMVVRFSIPDSPSGTGTKGYVSLYVNDAFIQRITLDSYWAWQYALLTGQTYPDNLPAENKFARMRFDDVRIKLPDQIPCGATFKLVKEDADDVPYTIDYVELEPVPPARSFASIPDVGKVEYHAGKAGSLEAFIAANGGKTIYIPPGKYTVNERIVLSEPGTKLIGAGMWYTEIYFSAPPDREDTFAKRGIQSDRSDIVIDGLYITTANNRRYYVFNGRNGQAGKGLMGSFGSNSVIKNVWIEHFECGGWIDGADNLAVRHCRFRNQYADGINLSLGSRNSVVEHCSFRNNGDDDMASWSRGQSMCENVTFQYNTAENNWRASSVGFFGGKGHKALNLVILDPMEAALRVTTDFPGREFSDGDFIVYDGISVYRGGGRPGPLGFYGDIINGAASGAIHITSYLQYDIRNIKFSNIDLYHSKYDAIFIDSRNEKTIASLYFENIHIYGAARHGISFNDAAGEAFYCNVVFDRVGAGSLGSIPGRFTFTLMEDCRKEKTDVP